MRRPAIIVLLGYIVGIQWGLYLKISIAFFLPFFLVLCYGIWKIETKSKYIRLLRAKLSYTAIIIISLSTLVGNSSTLYKQKQYEEIYQQLAEKEEFIATVVGNKEEKEYKERYIIKIESINGKKDNRNIRLYLNRKLVDKQEKELEYGDLIYFKGNYELPSAERNDKGFNYQTYLKSIGISGNVTSKGKIKTLRKKNTNLLGFITNKMNLKIKERIEKLFLEEISPVITGILLGDTSKIEEEIKDNFKDSNLSHLLAVSGTHVSNIVLGITLLQDRIKVHKKIKSSIVIIILFLFISITGSTPSVIRACVMSIVQLMASLIYRKSDIINTMAIVCLFLCISNPFCLFNIGLLLSFGGTVGIVLFNSQTKNKQIGKEEKLAKKIKNTVIQMSYISIAAQVIIFPIVLVNFNTISLTFLISNLLAGPLLSILIMLGFITVFISFVFFPIATLLSNIVSIIVSVLLQITKICANLPFSKIYCITPKTSLIFIYYIGIFYLYYLYQIRKCYLIAKYWNVYKRKIVIITGIIFIVGSIMARMPADLIIDFIDVGQGDCCLVVTPYGKRILIDGGGSENKQGFEIGEDVVLPHLLKHGIARIDDIMISHFDSDHVGRTTNYYEGIKSKKRNYWETI